MTTTFTATGVRRATMLVGLAGFPLAGLVAALIDSNEGTDTPASDLYDTMAAHGDAVLVSALVFMVSALLTVPAACAGLHLARDRGSHWAEAAAAFMTLGALGHMGYATWQVMVSRVAGSDRDALTAYLDDLQGTTNALLLPLLFCIAFGVLFQAIGLYRAGAAPRWFLWAVVALLCFDVVMNSTSLGSSRLPVLTVWTVLTLLYGQLAYSLARAPRRRSHSPQPSMTSPARTAPARTSAT